MSGSSKITLNKAQIQNQFPLLSYTVDWWKNGVASFLNLSQSFEIPFSLIFDTFLPLMWQFLETKPTVTVWVESIWTLSETPPLQLLSDQIAVWGAQLSSLVSETYSASIENLLQAGKAIAELSFDLQHMYDEWSSVLIANPTELWEPSINAFHSSRFLIRTDVSNITWFTASYAPASGNGISTYENHSAGGMTLLSQASRDGSSLGSIRLIPPT